jgi:hypothetical protein
MSLQPAQHPVSMTRRRGGREAVILLGVIPRHILGKFSNLEAAARGALEISEKITIPEHHFPRVIEGIPLTVAANATSHNGFKEGAFDIRGPFG